MPEASNRKIWMDGQLVPVAEARVSVYDHAVLYGDGVFEGMRGYGGKVFKLASHLARLEDGASRIRLKIPYSTAELGAAVKDTMAACGIKDGYIRLVVTRGIGTLGLNPYRCPTPGRHLHRGHHPALQARDVREGHARHRRQAAPRPPSSASTRRIKSLNYLNNILAKCEAIDAEVLEAIMLNTDGFVGECTGDNIFAVRGKQIHTPPVHAGILHGITRRFVIDELAPALGYTVTQPNMRLEDLLGADEVFLTGTAAEIIGVSAIGDARIGAGRVGPVTKSLEDEFRRRVKAGAPED
jgi:branched-chain amino acid aminotransferase